MKKAVEESVRHSFPPIYDAHSRVLILGSLPSVASREADFYYMHPQNRFWRVMSALLGEDFTLLSAKEKTAALLKKGVALYDVVLSCRITGSGDASIKNVEYADIPSILEKSNVRKILLNGQKAYALFKKGFPCLTEKAILLPSTSPANAKCGFDALLRAWKEGFSAE